MSKLLKTMIILVAAAGLAGCISTPEMENIWVFNCPDGYQFTAKYSRDFEVVLIEAEGFSEKLRRAEAASGARYVGDTAVFWAKGVMALLDIDEQEAHRDCRGDAA